MSSPPAGPGVIHIILQARIPNVKTTQGLPKRLTASSASTVPGSFFASTFH
jgi:hypothetical protein